MSRSRRVNEPVAWYTPPEIFEALDLTFDLDPCSPGPGRSFVPAHKHYTMADDGLNQPWEGTAFVHPPAGPTTKVWMEKLAEHGDGLGLVCARPDATWFQIDGVKADVVCFVNSRIKFFHGDIATRGEASEVGSMMLAYGAKAARALTASGLGACFTLLEGTAIVDPQLDLFADATALMV